jgi:hypothetical protein
LGRRRLCVSEHSCPNFRKRRKSALFLVCLFKRSLFLYLQLFSRCAVWDTGALFWTPLCLISTYEQSIVFWCVCARGRYFFFIDIFYDGTFARNEVWRTDELLAVICRLL